MACSYEESVESCNVNLVNDEKLEETYRPNDDAIQIVDNGRACEKIRLSAYGCALGKHSYHSGIHCIRLRMTTLGVAMTVVLRRTVGREMMVA
ncbi:unnamed protein product [Adineta ricciae]|uniref:Uncharacterized protein n=1 Tax=Adineta ricciae TaxID=249248 RepID=A0A815FNR9_ADIRI|nr:unnamed protein product [Adineta ricciae]